MVWYGMAEGESVKSMKQNKDPNNRPKKIYQTEFDKGAKAIHWK